MINGVDRRLKKLGISQFFVVMTDSFINASMHTIVTSHTVAKLPKSFNQDSELKGNFASMC